MRSPSFHQRPRGPRSDSGFALLLVLGLLSLVVLVLVSLATFTKVETSVVGISQQQAKARQNALFALNQAVGLLQRTAGPDTRVTATAELLLNTTVTGEQKHITGVWDTSTNSLLTWLVNGNDSDFAAVPYNTVVPTDVLTDPDGASGANWVWLLKNGVKRTDGTILADRERVRVQKSMIDASDIPGYPAGTSRTIGRYAFWVSDEGVKHSLGMWDRTSLSSEDQSTAVGQRNRTPNLVWNDNYGGYRDFRPGKYGIGTSVGATAIPDEFDTFGDYNRQRTRQLIAQEGRLDYLLDAYRGINPTTGFPTIGNIATGIDLQRSPYRERVARRGDLLATIPYVSAVTNATFSAAQRSAAQNDLHTLLAENYHSITEQTFGVLADTVVGGLRAVVDNPAVHTNAIGVPTIRFSTDPLANGYDAGTFGIASYLAASNVFPSVDATFDPIRTESGIVRPINPDDGSAFAEADFGGHQGKPVYLVAPVIVNYILRLRFDDNEPTGSGTGIVATTVSLDVEFWNPYSSALQVGALQLQLRNLPNLTLEDQDGTLFTIDLQTQVPGLTAITLPALRASGFDYVLPGTRFSRNFPLPAVTVTTPISGPVNGPFKTASWKWLASATDTGLVTVLLADGAGNPLRAYDQISWPEQPSPVALPLGDEGIDFQWRIKGPSDDFLDFADPTNPLVNSDGQPDWLTILDPNSPRIVANTPAPGLAGGNQAHAYYYGLPTLSSAVNLPGLVSIPTAFPSGPSGTYVLFDLPRQAPLSIGSLRHLPVMPRAIGGVLTNVPAYAIGSSAQIVPAYPVGTVTPRNGLAPVNFIPDVGNLNQYFDKYFVTALPATELAANEVSSTYNGAAFPNSNLQLVSIPGSSNSDRKRLLDDIARGGRNTSRYLLVRNSFNINSTSVPAWRALLAGALFASRDYNPAANGIPDDYWRYFDGSASVSAFDPLTYFRYPDGTNMPTKGLHNLWFRTPQGAQFVNRSITPNFFELRGKPDAVDRAQQLGIRPLTSTEIDVLAQCVVEEIKSSIITDWDKNGQYSPGIRLAYQPYLSLNQFITSGVLERAIARASSYSGLINNGELNPPNPGSIDVPNPPTSSGTIAGTPLPKGLPLRAPFTLTQNDLLERLAPVLSARSDTFVIRAYGESGNPNEDPTDTNRDFTTGEAWLEAVVQRFPDYIDQTDTGMNDPVPAEGKDVGDAVATSRLQSNTNKALGRKFRIISVRWLAPEEI